MLSDELKKKLIEKKPNRNENIGKLIYRLYRYIHSWLDEKNPDRQLYRITPSHMALLCNISDYGGNNKELAQRAIISKQAMSKLLNETLNNGLIEIEKNKTDCRSNNVDLTEKGAELLISIWESNHLLVEDFEKYLGKEKTQQLLDLLSELSNAIGICGKK